MSHEPDGPTIQPMLRFDYRAFSQRILRGGFGAWLPKPIAFLRVFTSRESDIILHLVNVGKLSQDPDSLGWVMSTENFLSDGLQLDTVDQQEIVGDLIRLRVLEKKTIRGMRHLRVDVQRVTDLIDQAPKYSHIEEDSHD